MRWSLYDIDLINEILNQITTAYNRIQRRCENTSSLDDFLASEEGIDKPDAICMMLIAIGENLKNLDKITDEKLLSRYPVWIGWHAQKKGFANQRQ